MDLAEFLKIRAKKYGEKPFLLGEGTSVSYWEFDEITDKIAYGLEKIGVERGDHIAVLHPNSPQVLLIYYSIIKAGGIVVPINTIYTPREIRFILSNSDAKTLILHDSFLPKIEKIEKEVPLKKDIIARKSDEAIEMVMEKKVGSTLKRIKRKRFGAHYPAIIFYTSGTTGNPKGVILTHRNFCFGGPNIAQNYGLTENDISIVVLPMVHVFSIASPFFGSLSSGGSVVVLERFKTELVLEAIAKYKVTWFPGVPTMFTYRGLWPHGVCWFGHR
jgi:long-chain acyl-CoA synthetase